MSIKKLLNDVFERIDYLDENIENPFLNKDNQGNQGNQGNPFAKFFNGTYVWIENTQKTNNK